MIIAGRTSLRRREVRRREVRRREVRRREVSSGDKDVIPTRKWETLLLRSGLKTIVTITNFRHDNSERFSLRNRAVFFVS